MAANFPGPYELRYFFTVSGIEHQHRINIQLTTDPAPGSTFDDIDVILKSTASQGLETAADVYGDLIRAMYTAANDFSRVELWKYAPSSYESTFVSAMDINATGTGASSSGDATYNMLTYRTGGGSVIRQTFLESGFPGNDLENFPISAAPFAAMADYVVSTASMVLGRDGTYAISKLHFARGQNEAVWRKRHRPAS